jgi:lytic murein transglycosylase
LQEAEHAHQISLQNPSSHSSINRFALTCQPDEVCGFAGHDKKAMTSSHYSNCICVTAAVLLIVTPAPAAPAPCRNIDSFERWLEGFQQEAAAQGISQRAIAAASPGMTYDQGIINRDRGQKIFAENFLEFSDRMLRPYRLEQGPRMIKKHEAVFARIDQQYGVPAPVIVALWGLESDFGANNGKLPVLRSLATLAYDCRRSEMFRSHLFDALRIIARGDLAPADMLGSGAGELGQTQMMASDYFKYAVDYDNDGRRDLIKSVPDVLASTANYLIAHGWRRGEPWLQEVRAPPDLGWEEADLAIQHPRAQWARWGVTLADGRPLPVDNFPASLLLPMGRFGPAFLAYGNFQVFLKWNQSLSYSNTAAYYATRIAGAPPARRSGAIPFFSVEQTRELQQILMKQGFDIGGADGKLGLATRAAVKQIQVKLGLPADSYPTIELLEQLRTLR